MEGLEERRGEGIEEGGDEGRQEQRKEEDKLAKEPDPRWQDHGMLLCIIKPLCSFTAHYHVNALTH